MKKTTIKQLLFIFALLLGGASSAWADPTVIYHRALTTADGATVWDASDIGTGKWVANGNATVTGDNTNGLKVTTNGDGAKIATATYTNLITPTDDYILNFSIVWNTGVNTYNYASYNSLQIGNNITIYNVQEGSGSNLAGVVPDLKSCVKIGSEYFYLTNAKDKDHNITERVQEDIWTINIQINLITNKIESLTLTGSKNQESGDGDTKVNLTKSNLSLPDGTTFNDWILTGRCGAKAGSSGSVWTALQSVKITETEPAKYGYYVKYCTDPSNVAGTTVKTVDMTAAANKVYNLKTVNADVTAFTESATKYYVADDATTSFQITKDNQECVVKVRVAYSIDWELRGKYGEIDLGLISSGTQTEGETVNTYYKRYLLKNGTLYGLASGKGSNKSYFNHGFTINEGSEDDQIEYLDYTAEVYNVVALVEVEDVEGVTMDVYLANRSSGGHNANPAGQVMCTLPAGEYKIVNAAATSSADRTIIYKNSGTTIGTATLMNTTNCTETTTDWFSVTGVSNDITASFNKTASSGRIDYLYVQRRCETVSNVDALGYTFSSTMPLDFTDTGVEAYIATYTSGNTVSLKRVYKVPANTGLFIKSSSSLSNVSIPTTTAATDDVTGNVLVAQSTTGAVAQTTDTKTNYVLGLVDKNDTSKGSSFFKVPTAGVEVAAGKAYLSINYSSGGLSRMNIVFEDEATGISDATHLNENGKMTNANYYDLSGRRVAQPTKGLYIVNGKKVVIK